MVLEAVEGAGFQPTGHTLTLNSLENRVYDLKLEDESHIIAKFYRPGRWSQKQILEEHQLLFELQKSDIPVCVPLPFPGGGTLRMLHGMFVAVWPRTGGRSPDDLTTEELQILGRTIARIHNTGETQNTTTRPHFNEDTYIHKPLQILEKSDSLSGPLYEEYRKVALEVSESYRSFGKTVQPIRIHGDCHRGNILHNNGSWFFLDFDDTLMGPPVQDLWMIVSEDRPEEQEALISGYQEFRDFATGDLQMIPILRAMRFIHYSAWILKRWEDPAFPLAFPHFGTEEYWQQEIRDLQRILDRDPTLRDEPSRQQTIETYFGENPEELTNSDYFWDL